MRKVLGGSVMILGAIIAGAVFIFQAAIDLVGTLACVISSGR